MQETKKELGEQDLQKLYNFAISYTYEIELANKLYSRRVLDINQFITRVSDLTKDFGEVYNNLTDNGETAINFSASLASKDNEKGKANT